MEPGRDRPGELNQIKDLQERAEPQWSRGVIAPESAELGNKSQAQGPPQWSRGVIAPERRKAPHGWSP